MSFWDFVRNLGTQAVGNYARERIMGNDPDLGETLKITLLNQGINAALGQGGNQNIFSNLFGGSSESQGIGAAETQADRAINIAQNAISNKMDADAKPTMSEAGRKVASSLARPKSISKFEQAPGTLGYSKFLVDSGIFGPDNRLVNLLNSPVGEALATALVSGIGSKVFDQEDQVGPPPKPFGGVEGYTRLNVPRRMEYGGTVDGQYFPRRNGGIMPHEGSGQKDDVPAMLMAGEFVLTKNAIKGLGNGDSKKGIEKAYSMMRTLENKANNYG
jgi:hypothetical protein